MGSDCIICVVKCKALISFEITAKLICAFVFAFSVCRSSDILVHMSTFSSFFIGQMISFPFNHNVVHVHSMWSIKIATNQKKVAPFVIKKLISVDNCTQVQNNKSARLGVGVGDGGRARLQ